MPNEWMKMGEERGWVSNNEWVGGVANDHLWWMMAKWLWRKHKPAKYSKIINYKPQLDKIVSSCPWKSIFSPGFPRYVFNSIMKLWESHLTPDYLGKKHFALFVNSKPSMMDMDEEWMSKWRSGNAMHCKVEIHVDDGVQMRALYCCCNSAPNTLWYLFIKFIHSLAQLLINFFTSTYRQAS